MAFDATDLAQRLREVRVGAGVSQDAAREAIKVSQPTYSRIETGDRVLKGDELVLLADLFGVRAAVITGMPQLRKRTLCAARTNGSSSGMETMREKLHAYLELDSYLADQGIPEA